MVVFLVNLQRSCLWFSSFSTMVQSRDWTSFPIEWSISLDSLILRDRSVIQISEFQRSKANHNPDSELRTIVGVVTNIRISKIESKSQRESVNFQEIFSCYKYQNFKDRKQITTAGGRSLLQHLLLQISKFQRSKANHNPMSMAIYTLFKYFR